LQRSILPAPTPSACRSRAELSAAGHHGHARRFPDAAEKTDMSGAHAVAP